jgi:YgiT-type zinc finger domain-containing protein
MGRRLREEEMMRCSVCKNGDTERRTATLSVERGVPAEICANCGEEFLDAEIVKEMEAAVARAESEGVDVAVQKYHAA